MRPESSSLQIAFNLLRGILALIVIIVLTIDALQPVDLASDAVEKRFISSTDDLDRRVRFQTLRKAANNTIRMIILVIAVLIGLGTFRVNIGPALEAVCIFG